MRCPTRDSHKLGDMVLPPKPVTASVDFDRNLSVKKSSAWDRTRARTPALVKALAADPSLAAWRVRLVLSISPNLLVFSPSPRRLADELSAMRLAHLRRAFHSFNNANLTKPSLALNVPLTSGEFQRITWTRWVVNFFCQFESISAILATW